MQDHSTTDSRGTEGDSGLPAVAVSRRSALGPLALAVGAGVLLGALLSASWAGGGQLQDPAISQLQRQMNNLQVSVNNRLSRLESQVGQNERSLVQVDHRLRDVERVQRDTALLPRRDLPVPVAQELFDVRVLRAESFLLRDTEGRVRATLTLQEGRPVLTLLGEDDREMAVLEVTEEGAATLRLRDAEGTLRPVALQ